MATKDTADGLVVALESFVGLVGSEDRFVREGDLVRASDPIVRKFPKFFAPAIATDEPRIEQATAAPGEKRGA